MLNSFWSAHSKFIYIQESEKYRHVIWDVFAEPIMLISNLKVEN
jgi:hypothetical protein